MTVKREGPEYVLMTRELIGCGTTESPHRELLRFWHKETLMNIADHDPIELLEEGRDERD